MGAAERADHKADEGAKRLADCLLRALAAVALVIALAGAGCTGKLALTPAATLEKPAFDVSPEKGDAATTFHVDAGALSKYEVAWDFGDGASAKGPTAEHKYGFTNGIMTITLLAADPVTGKQAIATRTITLGSGTNHDPRVSISASTVWTEIRKSVTLNAFGRDSDRDPLDHLWTYSVLSGGIADDGHGHVHGPDGKAASTGQESVLAGNGSTNSVAFDAAGKYLVKVRVRDPKNGEDMATTTIDVSKHIPDRVLDIKYNGTLVAGTLAPMNTSASETLWGVPGPAPDTFADAARYPYALLYPASTILVLTWNDTSTQGVWDLDLELRNTDTNKTVFRSAHHIDAGPPPHGAPPIEFNFTNQEPGHYVVIVRGVSGAKIQYDLLVHANLFVTPELVAANEK